METIAEIVFLTKGHGESLKGLSGWDGVFPSEFHWERIAVPFSSAWKGRNWIACVVACVFKIGLLRGSVDLFRLSEIGCDGETICSWGRCRWGDIA